MKADSTDGFRCAARVCVCVCVCLCVKGTRSKKSGGQSRVMIVKVGLRVAMISQAGDESDSRSGCDGCSRRVKES